MGLAMKNKSKKLLTEVSPFLIGPVKIGGQIYNIRNTIKRTSHKVTDNKDKYEGNPIYQYKNWVLMKMGEDNVCLWMELA